MKNILDKYKNIILTTTATGVLITSTYAGVCVLIDFRAQRVVDKETAPLKRELQYINCNLRAMLTQEQQENADALFKYVQVGNK